MISIEPFNFVSFECDLFEKIIRYRTVLGTPRLRANAFTFNISLGELGHPDRGWNEPYSIRPLLLLAGALGARAGRAGGCGVGRIMTRGARVGSFRHERRPPRPRAMSALCGGSGTRPDAIRDPIVYEN